MSYILEALKKSEQERRLGRVPDVTASPSVAPVVASQDKADKGNSFRRYGLWLLGILLAANLAFTFWLFLGQETQPASPVEIALSGTETPDTTGARGEFRMSHESGISDAAPQVVDPGEKALEKSAPPVVLHPKRLPSSAVEDRKGLETAVAKPPELAEPPVTQNVSPSPPKMPSPVPTWDELPVSIRGQFRLPRLDVHVYAPDPSRRFVRLDLAKYREGDRTPEGLLVERIRRDGVVLSWQGTRFLITRP